MTHTNAKGCRQIFALLALCAAIVVNTTATVQRGSAAPTARSGQPGDIDWP